LGEKENRRLKLEIRKNRKTKKMKKDKKFVISEIIKRGMIKEQKKVAVAEKKVNGQLKNKKNENNNKYHDST